MIDIIPSSLAAHVTHAVRDTRDELYCGASMAGSLVLSRDAFTVVVWRLTSTGTTVAEYCERCWELIGDELAAQQREKE